METNNLCFKNKEECEYTFGEKDIIHICIEDFKNDDMKGYYVIKNCDVLFNNNRDVACIIKK